MGRVTPPDDSVAADRALHDDAIVIDALPREPAQPGALRAHAGGRGGHGQLTITLADGVDFHRMLDEIQRIDRLLAEHADLVRRVRSVADIRAARREQRVGIIDGFQNAIHFERNMRRVAPLRELGVLIVPLPYTIANLLADGCLEPRNAGLTFFGRALVDELNRLGVLVDLWPVGDRSALEAIDHSAAPVAMTHANCHGLGASPRNKIDEAIRTLARRGGVIGFTRLPASVSR